MTAPANSEEAIFGQAVDLPAGERTTYLDRACGDDAALRARVEALLHAHDEAGELLDAAPGDVVRAALVQPPLEEKPGILIGRYKLLQKIGEGGCGVVWMAEQQEPVVRRVALKVIKLGMDTREVVARFEAERQALALMDHPNIARVLDAGATGTGRPFVVMELVRGVPLTTYCDGNNLPTPARLELFMQVCSAVQHAHQKGIIHRDLKPSNILVTVNDGVPVPKVIDFGIAKATQGRLTDRTLFTAFEQFIGTPAYMSPEQAEMSSVDVDTRSDIYSLGVLLYELLTGQTPFDAKSLLRAGLDEVRRVIREVEPPKPSARLSTLTDADRTTVAKLRSTAPVQLSTLLRGDLDWIVMRCLEKDRRRRYETASGLAEDIRRHLGSEPVVARPPATAYLVQKLIRRNRLAFAAATAVAAALLLGFGVSTWQYLKERAARERAVAAEQKARTEAQKSTQVARFLKDMLEGVGPSVALGRDTTLLREILDKTAERVGHDLKNQPEVEAELRATIANVYFALGDYGKAETLFRVALAMRRQLYGPEHPLVATSLNDLGVALLLKGYPAEAEPMIREALALRRKLLGNRHRDVAGSLLRLGDLLIEKNQTAQAESPIREAQAILRSLPVDDDQQWAINRSLNLLSVILSARGDLAEAEALSREMITIQRKLAGRGDPSLLPTQLNVLAWLLLQRDELVEAESALREAVELSRRLLGSEHPQVAQFLSNLSGLLVLHGKLAEAEALIRDALAISRKQGKDESPDVIWQTGVLARTLQMKGDWSAAEAVYRDALALIRKHPEMLDDYLVTPLIGLGEVLRQRGLFDEAEPLLREALALQRQKEPQERGGYSELIGTLDNLGAISLHHGDRAEAGAMLREAFSIQARLPDSYFFRKAQTHLLLADVLRASDDLAGAEQLLIQAQEIVQTTQYWPPPELRREIIASLAGVYESWTKTDLTKAALAAEWQQKLTDFNKTPQP